MIRHNDLVTFSRSLITVAAATAVALSGVTIAQTASAQTTTREWTFVDFSDSDTTLAKGYGGSFTFTNPTQDELICTAYIAEPKYTKAMIDVWVNSTDSWNETAHKAYERVDQLHRDEERTGRRLHVLAQRGYIAPGESVELAPDSEVSPSNGIFLECSSQNGNETNLYGYGTIESDYSIKSSIPVANNSTPTPPATPIPVATVTKLVTPAPITTTVTDEPVTTTQLVPTTIRETATTTATEPVPTTIRETATTTATESVPTTVTKPVPTTVRQTVVSQFPAETVTQTRTTTVTSTLAAPTVTRTVSAEPSDSGSSDSSVIGWIIGIFAALGLGGIAGFLAQNFNIPGLTF